MRPAPIDPRAHRVLAGLSRVRVLEFLRDLGRPATAPDVAAGVGLHANTVRLHLDQLADAGLVTRERERRPGPGRPRLLYAAAENGPEPAEEDGYRVLAGILAGQLEAATPDPAGRAAEAGRAWAGTLGPRDLPAPATRAEVTGHLVRVLDELGFAPRASAPEGPIELHRCPFAEVALQHTGVVCGVHLGLMQGLLDDLQPVPPVHATRLEPFVAPGLCLAHLEPTDTESTDTESTEGD